MQGVKQEADLVIDTTGLTIHQLKARLTELFSSDGPARACRWRWCRSASSTACALDVNLASTCGSCRTRSGAGPAPAHGSRRTGAALRGDRAITGEFLTRVDELLTLLVPPTPRRARAT